MWRVQILSPEHGWVSIGAATDYDDAVYQIARHAKGEPMIAQAEPIYFYADGTRIE
jgi:hypothetical protein